MSRSLPVLAMPLRMKLNCENDAEDDDRMMLMITSIVIMQRYNVSGDNITIDGDDND